METVYRDYAPKGVRFLYLYKALAHPELNGYVNPITLEERLMHVEEARRVLGSEIAWIADNMANELKHALGNRQNSEYVLDPEGRILRARAWSDPDQLRRDLAEFVGPVENPTEVSDLNMQIMPAPEHAKTGVVPRIEKPGTYRTLISRPQLAKTGEPFYTKLRAEADQDLLRSGEGKLYLAFLLDPLHGVHWNNLAPAMDVELSASEGVRITPAKLQGPKVEEDADADPREFLVHVKRGDSQEPLGMRFRYFACTDTWCRPVTQEYLITWEVDRDAGRVRSGRMDFNRTGPGRGPRGRPGQGGRPRGAGGGFGSQQFVERLLARDRDGDDRLTLEELPERMRRNFDHMDRDGDGHVEPSEIQAMMQQDVGRNRPPEGRGGLARWDSDGDGQLSIEEVSPQIERRFGQLDTNRDGLLDQAELSVMRGRGRAPPSRRQGHKAQLLLPRAPSR
ncbi:MAG: hypothetical protein F4X77_04930 [Acidobacteriia bacterium]|nr:hypothetical protein [Terriglobia bacterium]